MSRYRIEWAGLQVELRDRSVLGRTPDCEISLTSDTSVSKRHVALTVCAHGIVVEDLHSKNGVWIDGERLDRSRLLVGSHTLRVGRTDMRLVDVEAELGDGRAGLPEGQSFRGNTSAANPRVSSAPPPAPGALERASGWLWSRKLEPTRPEPEPGEESEEPGMEHTG